MKVPSLFQWESVTQLIQGMGIGALATVAVGFGWGGWLLESTATNRAADGAKTAVVAALAPICVDKFQHAAEAPSNLAQFRRTASYAQADFVERGGWASSPGSTGRTHSDVAYACARLLNSLK